MFNVTASLSWQLLSFLCYCNSSMEDFLLVTVLCSSSQAVSTEREIKHVMTRQTFSLSMLSYRTGKKVYLNGRKYVSFLCQKHLVEVFGQKPWDTGLVLSKSEKLTGESFGTIVV